MIIHKLKWSMHFNLTQCMFMNCSSVLLSCGPSNTLSQIWRQNFPCEIYITALLSCAINKLHNCSLPLFPQLQNEDFSQLRVLSKLDDSRLRYISPRLENIFFLNTKIKSSTPLHFRKGDLETDLQSSSSEFQID